MVEYFIFEVLISAAGGALAYFITRVFSGG